MNRRDFLLSTSGLMLVSAASEAYDASALERSPWLEKVAKQLCEEFKVPAVWLAGGTDGVIEQAVAGVRKVGDPTPADLKDRLMVGSITKPITGLWIASLIDEGKLTYDTRLLDILPELREGCLAEHKEITLGQLLTHTAGLIRDVGNKYVDVAHPERYPEERLRFSREALGKPSPREAVGHELYSNIGVDIAGSMAERAAERSYDKDIIRFFKEKVSLLSFGLGEPNLKDDISGPWSHNMADGVATPTKPSHRHALWGAFPSGGAHCTISDLASLGIRTARGFQGKDQLLRASTWARSLTVPMNLHATATTLSSFERAAIGEGLPFLKHQGGLDGGSSELWIMPEFTLVSAVHTTANWNWTKTETNAPFLARAHQLVIDELRHRRGQRLGPRNSVSLDRVTTVDAGGRDIVPKRGDDKIRIAIEVEVRGGRCGDIKITCKLGDEQREANYFRGLGDGRQRCATFEWDLPKAASTPFVTVIDACRSCGDPDPKGKRFEAPLVIADN